MIDGKEPWKDEKEGMQASRRRRNKKTRQTCLPNVSAWYWRLTCCKGSSLRIPWDRAHISNLGPLLQTAVQQTALGWSSDGSASRAGCVTFTSRAADTVYIHLHECFLRSILIARSSQSAKQAPSLLCAGSIGMYQTLMPDLRATKELKTKQRSSSMGHPAAREGRGFMLGQTEEGVA